MDIKIIETFDDSQVIKRLEELDANLGKIEGSAKSLTGEMEGAMKKIAAATDDVTEAIEKQGDGAAAAASQNERLTGTSKGLLGQLKGLITESAAYRKIQSALTATTGAMNSAMSGSSRVTDVVKKGFSALWTVIRANPIGILITAILAVVSHFFTVKEAVKTFEKATFAAGAVVQVLIKRFGELGGAIFNTVKAAYQFITLDWSGAGESMKKAAESGKAAFSGLAGEIEDVATEAYRIKGVIQDIEEDAKRRLIQVAETEKKIAELRLRESDDTLSLEARIKASQEAAKGENQLYADRLDFAKRFEAAMFEAKVVGAATEDDYRDAAVARIKAEEEYSTTQYRNAAQIRQLKKEQADRDEREAKKREEEQERLNKLIEQYNKLRQSTGDQAQLSFTTESTQRQAIQSLEVELRKLGREIAEAQKLATEAGLEYDLSDEFGRIKDSILFSANKELFEKLVEEFAKRKAEAISKGLAFDNKAEVEKIIRDVQGEAGALGVDSDTFIRMFLGNAEQIDKAGLEAIRRIISAMKANALPGLSQEENAFDSFKKKLLKSLGITEEEAKEIFAALEGAIDTALDGYEELLSARIEFQDALIAKIDESITKQEQALAKEIEFAKQGEANSVETEKRKLEALQAERAKAEAEKAKLERKAANAQLAVDSAVMASNIAVAVTRLLAQGASGGVVGLVVALGAISLLYKIFATSKANAIRASAQKLRKGKRITGKSHEQGGEPHIGIDGELYETEDAEWVIGTKHSKEHDRFLHRLNDGKYEGRDLVAELGDGQRTKSLRQISHAVTDAAAKAEAAERNATSRAIAKAIESQTADIQAAIMNRPHFAPVEHVQIKENRTGTTKIFRQSGKS